MSDKQDPTKPVSNDKKFKPKNVAESGQDKGRKQREMEDVARGSEGYRRRNSAVRHPDQG